MAGRGLLGSVLLVVGVQFSVLSNTFAKLLGAVPILQLLQGRFLLQWLASASLCTVLRLRGYPISILGPPGQRAVLAARALTFTCALGCQWCALRYLRVGEVTAIIYLNPVLCGLLARHFRGETLGLSFAIQAIANTTGVMLVVGLPSGGAGDDDGVSHGVTLALMACLCFALTYLLVGFLSCHPLEVQVCSDSITALAFMPVALLAEGATGASNWDSRAWGGGNLLMLAGFSASGLAASLCIILGYQLAEASKVAPFMYVEVVSAFAVQVFFFEASPEPRQVAGAAIIASAALLRLALQAWPGLAEGKGESDSDLEPEFRGRAASWDSAPFVTTLGPPLAFERPRSLTSPGPRRGPSGDDDYFRLEGFPEEEDRPHANSTPTASRSRSSRARPPPARDKFNTS